MHRPDGDWLSLQTVLDSRAVVLAARPRLGGEVVIATVYAGSPLKPKRRRRTRAELDAIDEAIVAAAADEPPITLRGVYYRVVSAGAIEKTEAAYDLVGRQLLKLRRAGRVPYSAITDGTRYVISPRTQVSLDSFLDAAASSYRRMLWLNQTDEAIIFTEKDAIVGVLEPVTSEWDVGLGVLRGYASESFTWNVAEGLRHKDWPVYFYQLGDHDPSGVDAWRAFRDSVLSLAPEADVHFERLAVTPEQIVEMGLPTRPTKPSDSRAAKFAGESVEVDAIRPAVLRQIVRDAIEQHIDVDALRVTRVAEREERRLLLQISRQFRGRAS
jgi:hypothetical protein